MFEALREKSRLTAELDSANATIEAQNQEIARLREAVRVRSDCIKELCGCLGEAQHWIDPIMVGPVTQSGESLRTKLLDRISAAMTWAGHKPASSTP